jgi:hypothetical protein
MSQSRAFFSRRLVRAILAALLLYVLEMLSYFVVAERFGALFGAANTLNFQLPVDRLTPWCTPFFAVYIPWPFMWFAAIPLILFGAGGRPAFWRYIVNGLFMYAAGTLIYMIFPTTTTPLDFIDGTIQTLPPASPFFEEINRLAHSQNNIWGSFPSYHNYWAALFIFFALAKDTRPLCRIPMILLGAAISLSTLFLHQHCVMDVILTYAMTALFLFIDGRYRLAARLEHWPPLRRVR